MDPAKYRVSLTCPKCYVKHLSAALAHTENARAAMNALVSGGRNNEQNFLGFLNYVSTADDEIKHLLPEFMDAVMRAKVSVAQAKILLDEAERYDGHEFMALGCLLDAELDLNIDVSMMFYRSSNEDLADNLLEIRNLIRFDRLDLQEMSSCHGADLEKFLVSMDYTNNHINNNLGPAYDYFDSRTLRWHDSFAYAQAHLMEACREMPDPNNHKVHTPFINELLATRRFPYTAMEMPYDSEGLTKVPDFILSELTNLSDAIISEIETFTRNSDTKVFSSEPTHEDQEGGDQ